MGDHANVVWPTSRGLAQGVRCGTLDVLIVNRKRSTCDGSALSVAFVLGEERDGSGTGSEKNTEDE